MFFLWSKSRRSRVFCYVRQQKHKKPSHRMAKGLSTNHKPHDKRATRKISCGTLAAIFRCNTALCDIFRIQVPIHRIIMCLLSCSILFFRLSERKYSFLFMRKSWMLLYMVEYGRNCCNFVLCFVFCRTKKCRLTPRSSDTFLNCDCGEIACFYT